MSRNPRFAIMFIIVLLCSFESCSNFLIVTTTSLGSLAFLTASFSPVSSVFPMLSSKSGSSPLIHQAIYSFDFFFLCSKRRVLYFTYWFLMVKHSKPWSMINTPTINVTTRKLKQKIPCRGIFFSFPHTSNIYLWRLSWISLSWCFKKLSMNLIKILILHLLFII